MADRLRAGFRMYDRHTSEWHMEMMSYDFPQPDMREIRESVPFRDGSFDFSFMYGAPTFEDRTISVVMAYTEPSWEARGDFIAEIRAWLLGRPEAAFECDARPNYEYYVRCVSVDDELIDYGVQLTITFVGQPRALNIVTGERAVV